MFILSVIILSYNTKELTIKCIDSIYEQYKDELLENKFEIIIVDNDSKDNSSQAINARVLEIRNLKLIKNRENLGFSKGCNIGAKTAKGRYLLFLNSDTKVNDRGFLKMIEFINNNQKVGILGGKLKNLDGSSQASSGKFYNLFNFFLMILGGERVGFIRESPDTIKKTDWVSGACMLVEKNVFEKLEGFDENLFMYTEDMEFCYRARKIGIAAYFYPDVSVFHKELSSSNKAFAIREIYKGILYFYKKHKPVWQYNLVRFILKFKAVVLSSLGSKNYEEAFKILG